MSTKTCPSCGAEVPAVARRCKHCFHDFEEEPELRRRHRGPLVLLGFVAAMGLVGFGTFAFVYHEHSAEKIVVDEETHSIVITRKSADRTETERIPFDDIVRIEHVMGGDHAMFEVVAVTRDGKRYVIKQSDDRPLTGHAEHIAAVVGRELEMVRKIKTFGD